MSTTNAQVRKLMEEMTKHGRVAPCGDASWRGSEDCAQVHVRRQAAVGAGGAA